MSDITYISTHVVKKPEPHTLCPRCKLMIWSGMLRYEHEYAIRHPAFPASG